MSSINSLNINGVDYSVGMNMAPCKLVGNGGGTIGSTAGSLTLSTSDYDFARVITVSNAVEGTSTTSSNSYTLYGGISSVSYYICNGASAYIRLGTSSRGTSLPGITTLTFSGSKCSYTANSRESGGITIELYKYV